MCMLECLLNGWIRDEVCRRISAPPPYFECDGGIATAEFDVDVESKPLKEHAGGNAKISVGDWISIMSEDLKACYGSFRSSEGGTKLYVSAKDMIGVVRIQKANQYSPTKLS